MKLHEITAPDREILQWLKDHLDPIYSATAFEENNVKIVDGTIDYNGHIALQQVRELPYKFGTINGSFKVNWDKDDEFLLKTLKNMPGRVLGSLYLGTSDLGSLDGMTRHVGDNCYLGRNNISSLDGIPVTVGGRLSISGTKITSLKGIHQKIKLLDGNIYLPPTIKSHLLGGLLIPGFQGYAPPPLHADAGELRRVVKIINDGGVDRPGRQFTKSNLLTIQQKLLDEGLDDYAQL